MCADGSGCQKIISKFLKKKTQMIHNFIIMNHLFIISLVPLRLSCERTNKVIRQNMRTGSIRFCGPIRLQFVKETADTIKSEFSYVEAKNF